MSINNAKAAALYSLSQLTTLILLGLWFAGLHFEPVSWSSTKKTVSKEKEPIKYADSK